MRIVVETRQDHGIEVPRTLRLNVDRVEVVEVLDQWYGPDYRYCKVKGGERCPLHPPPRRRPIRVAPHHVRECASLEPVSATSAYPGKVDAGFPKRICAKVRI